MGSVQAQRRLGLLAAALVAMIAGVHFQQYVDFMSLRFPIVLAIIAEALVLPVLGLLLMQSPAAVSPAGS